MYKTGLDQQGVDEVHDDNFVFLVGLTEVFGKLKYPFLEGLIEQTYICTFIQKKESMLMLATTD